MTANHHSCRHVVVTSGLSALVLGGFALIVTGTHALNASPPCISCPHRGSAPGEWAGTWYWLRSPEQERRAIASLFNRYCIRCHGVDGRGVWDIPDVPDFTNRLWQTSRSDAQLARLILEGRGAIMPAFRGTLSLEEAWAMARYLRTFVPGSQVSRPDFKQPEPARNQRPAPARGRQGPSQQ